MIGMILFFIATYTVSDGIIRIRTNLKILGFIFLQIKEFLPNFIQSRIEISYKTQLNQYNI